MDRNITNFIMAGRDRTGQYGREETHGLPIDEPQLLLRYPRPDLILLMLQLLMVVNVVFSEKEFQLITSVK
jgi:hypothetical protein